VCQAATTTAVLVRTVSGGLGGHLYASVLLAGWLPSVAMIVLRLCTSSIFLFLHSSCFCTRYFVLAPPPPNSPESSHVTTVPLSEPDRCRPVTACTSWKTTFLRSDNTFEVWRRARLPCVLAVWRCIRVHRCARFQITPESIIGGSGYHPSQRSA